MFLCRLNNNVINAGIPSQSQEYESLDIEHTLLKFDNILKIVWL